MPLNSPKFDSSARFLHWLSAVVIIWATLSGLYISGDSIAPELKHLIGQFNISLTTVFIPFFIWRLVNRLSRRAPVLNEIPRFQRCVACTMHLVIYLCIFTVLTTGVLMMDEPFTLFNLISIPNIVPDPQVTSGFEHLHKYASRFLGVCVLLHILAVVKHHLNGINLLGRMI